jgi:hypothetical protein
VTAAAFWFLLLAAAAWLIVACYAAADRLDRDLDALDAQADAERDAL